MTTSKLHFPNEGCFTQDALRCISHVTSLSREADCSSVSKTSREVELISSAISQQLHLTSLQLLRSNFEEDLGDFLKEATFNHIW